MTDPYCARCGNACEIDDNFCRRCGQQLAPSSLPVVRRQTLPVRSSQSSIPPSLVGSVAVLAVGTGLEWLARRVANNAARAAAKALLARDSASSRKPARLRRGDVTVNEVFYARKVQLRR